MKRTVQLIIGMVLTLSACGPTAEQQKAASVAKVQQEKKAYAAAFKIAVMPTMDCLPIYLLKDSMLYDSTRVDIRLLRFNAQMDCDTAMIGGSVQAAASDLIRTERLKRLYKIPMTYMATTRLSWQLIGNRQSKLFKLSDLSDKVVAMTRFSATDLLTDKVVRKAKPKYQVFRSQINDVFIRMKMLQNNELDAFWFAEPQATQARLLGHNVFYDSKEDAFRPGVIAFMERDNRNSQQEAFREAYDKAVELINRHGIAYYAALIKKYMQVDESTMKALPNIVYEKANPPRPSDILQTRGY